MNVELFGDYEWLKGRERQVTSQWGEDGLIEAVFERIGTTNRWCFECGASDGLLYSNTKVLRDAGWNSVLIEEDAKLFISLYQLADWRTFCICEKVTPDNIDALLMEKNVPTDLDLGVLDIDGLEYWVWDGMKRHKPRVMLVEFAGWNPDDHICSKDDCGTSDQSGRQTIFELGVRKGYRPVSVSGYNLLFVREDCL